MIVKAASCIPSPITAETGFVGIRIPSHPLSRLLLEKCDLPLAAPSANRFGHVSPTKSAHVMEDFGSHAAVDREVLILDGETWDKHESEANTCDVGIESTVIKILSDVKRIRILRQGAVGKEQLEKVLAEGGFLYEVEVVVRAVKMHPSSSGACAENEELDKAGEQAPGQAITHYAPDIPCVIASSITFADNPSSLVEGQVLELNESKLREVVIIDIGGVLSECSSKCLAYRDLSASGDASEAARGLFDALRWAEAVSGATLVVLPLIQSDFTSRLLQGMGGNDINISESPRHASDMIPGLVDRMFRAASGKFMHINVRNV